MISSDVELRSAVTAWPVGEIPGAATLASAFSASLKNVRDNAIARFVGESGYAVEDARLLCDAATRFLDELPALVDFHRALLEHERRIALPGLWSHTVGLKPWGTMLVCLPSNSILPLGAILPAALIAAGNRIIVAVSSGARRSGLLLLESLQAAAQGRMLVYGGSVRDAIDAACGAEPLVDAMYYMGGSGPLGTIAHRCAENGVALLYEGEGRGVVVVDDGLTQDEMRFIAEAIVDAKVFCLGKMCSAPNAVLVPRDAFEKFVEIYRETCARRTVEGDLKKLFTPALSDALGAIEETLGPPTRAHADGAAHPFFWIADAPYALKAPELFCPAIFLVRMPDVDTCFAAAAASRFRLQVAVFSNDQHRMSELVEQSQFARYCFWMNPAKQDAILPWGNYGRSGCSDVVDFYRKGLRRVIVESDRPISLR